MILTRWMPVRCLFWAPFPPIGSAGSLFRADEVGLALRAGARENGAMQRSCHERNHAPETPLPRTEALVPLGALDRAARVADVRDRMLACLEELDRLQLSYAANHLCHAIEIIEDAP